MTTDHRTTPREMPENVHAAFRRLKRSGQSRRFLILGQTYIGMAKLDEPGWSMQRCSQETYDAFGPNIRGGFVLAGVR